MMDIDKMCDRCLRMVGDNEKMYGFKIVDDEGKSKIVKGHKECVEEIMDVLQQLYRNGEKDER
ncbi:hypothetical protein [Bacillus phage vB_BsuS_PJN02]|nr:hypothetical protein PQE76_gp007 [Bacillus phage vB_BsuS_PJN02]UNH58350.1 hypothetical protein [Bacillus phage vB_BsuS_PJN02]